MNNRVSSNTLPNLLRAAAQGAADLQASDLVALEVGDVMGITDWFLIASSSNVRQVRRVAEEIESAVKKSGGEGPIRIEGLEEAKWILLDFGIFVVHVFHQPTSITVFSETLLGKSQNNHGMICLSLIHI